MRPILISIPAWLFASNGALIFGKDVAAVARLIEHGRIRVRRLGQV